MRIRFRLIPVTIVAATLAGGVKAGQIWSGAAVFFGVPSAVAKTGNAPHSGPMPLLPSSSAAQSPGPAAPAAKPAATAPAIPANATPANALPAATAAAGAPSAAAAATKAQKGSSAAMAAAPKSFNNPTQFSRADISLLQDLTNRRQELDRREQAIDMREKLMVAMSKRLDAKIAQMKALQASLKTLLAQQQAAHSQRIKNLVLVYQNMKPKDAARIFSRLQMPILLQVVSGMSENKLAPILAAMDPSKVQLITTELATANGSSGGAGAPKG